MEGQTGKFCYRAVNAVMPRTLWKQEEGPPALPGMRRSEKHIFKSSLEKNNKMGKKL